MTVVTWQPHGGEYDPKNMIDRKGVIDHRIKPIKYS